MEQKPQEKISIVSYEPGFNAALSGLVCQRRIPCKKEEGGLSAFLF